MASVSTEEERRLLREYRLTNIPSRQILTTNINNSSPTINNNQQKNHHHGKHHNHHHHHHHHHHGGNHSKIARHKNISTPTPDLTDEEINRMLELVSRLDYLKLVSSQTKSVSTATALSETDSNYNRTFIFEKVDYIKRISLRKKELKKLKKARCKNNRVH